MKEGWVVIWHGEPKGIFESEDSACIHARQWSEWSYRRSVVAVWRTERHNGQGDAYGGSGECVARFRCGRYMRAE
jgi:hypothetical protein